MSWNRKNTWQRCCFLVNISISLQFDIICIWMIFITFSVILRHGRRRQFAGFLLANIPTIWNSTKHLWCRLHSHTKCNTCICLSRSPCRIILFLSFPVLSLFHRMKWPFCSFLVFLLLRPVLIIALVFPLLRWVLVFLFHICNNHAIQCYETHFEWSPKL